MKAVARTGLMALSLAALAAGDAFAEPYAVPAVDAPELAALGHYPIGTRSIEVATPIPVELTQDGLVAKERKIRVRIWYPAELRGGEKPTSFTHALPSPEGHGVSFTISSLAVSEAPVHKEKRFPVVIVSHGYNGWDSFMTWLTENLATKGYIVVAIDHADLRATKPEQFPVSFGNVLINRAADVRATIRTLLALSQGNSDPLGSVLDVQSIALVGYSMGGFGSLAAAGLGYDEGSPVFAQLPREAREALFADQKAGGEVASRVKAVVALAPFGGRLDTRVWTEKTASSFVTPTLIVDGDQDDIVGYRDGVEWLFNHMAANRRHMLIFRNARHNVGGNPPPQEAQADFSTHEYFAEPLWRTDRINAINQHFITAFLGVHLRGDPTMQAYLDVEPAVAGDGNWPLAQFQSVGGQFASESQPSFWRGFQRRWALGLEMRTGRPDN